MSLLEDLGAQLRATCAELPAAATAVAIHRLRSASELLMWVRQTSVDPIGVPQLANAVEHAERAAAALRVAEDAIAAYLAAIGLGGDGARPPDNDRQPEPPAEPQSPPAPPVAEPTAPGLGSWWQARVEEITGEAAPIDGPVGDGGGDSAALLRRVAAGVRAGDRARIGADLHAVDAAVGLNLSAITPAVLRRLAGDLLGHEPGPDDLPRLRGAAADRTRALLPGVAPAVVDTVLARLCRAAPPTGAAVHPADSAITSGVLTAVLLARLGRDPSTLDATAAMPVATRHG